MIPNQQRGATLIVSLVMLSVVLLLATSLASNALMGERAARNERDRQVAMHAAEAALLDAETDIENSTAITSRSALFSPNSAQGFSEGCGRGDENKYQGLCLNSASEKKAAWLTVDLADASSHSASVPYGRFTGKTLPHSSSGAAQFPSQLPRYIIELMLDSAAGRATRPSRLYRITAIGFGSDSSNQVVMQSFYRKLDPDQISDAPYRFQAGFNKTRWSGSLKKIKVTPQSDGNLSVHKHAQWDAGELLSNTRSPANRVIATYNSEKKTNYGI
jgi:type IV pilus assembly protein PilX